MIASKGGRERERECVCVCVCVRERMRSRILGERTRSGHTYSLEIVAGGVVCCGVVERHWE